MQQFFKSVSIALQNIRANPLHTFLSTLGIIIGVAALVGILALGDGLEQTGRQAIANSTSLNLLTVSSKSSKTVKGVRVEVDDRPALSMDQVYQVRERYEGRATVEYFERSTHQVSYGDSLTGAYVQGNMEHYLTMIPDSLWKGRTLSAEDISEASAVAVLTYEMAKRLSADPGNLLGEKILLDSEELQVIGVLSERENDVPRLFVPITYFTREGEHYPELVLKVNKAEEIPQVEEELKAWLDEEFELGNEAFSFTSNQMRIEQFSQGILLFKLVMGAITGISVLVGGIGIMNVLLISVTERTKEIGIRKATGAKKKDIVLQFMAESVTVSMVGCLLGWAIGIAGTFAFVGVINRFLEIGQFQAAIGAGTVLTILLVALVTGVVFGTYPAWRAAQLTPVDAIRHE